MAAEVPASEVLCEAAEYLSKLGSNLRNRSENLKDKKIRKDKLNNVLALQKAASKVLLICELSKKSLENVESGVRKILQQIDKSQKSSPNGGKITESDKATSSGSTEPKYFYFEYKARKIKIKKKISLKHYTSVKVFAKRIPQSMIEKYPVYYDCKLYRTRKKEERFLNSKNKPEIAVSDLKDNNKEDSNECVKKLSEPIIPILYSPKSVRKIIEHEEIDTSVVSIADTSNSKKFTEDEKPDDSVICVEDDHAADDHKTSMKTSVARRISLDSKTKKDAKLKSEKDLKDNKHKSSQVSPKNPKEGGKYDNSKKKFKKVRILNDSSDEDVVEKSREISEVEEIKDLEQKNEGNKEVDENCSESAPKMRKHSHSVDQTQNDEKQDTNSEKKPIIKCVSLSKLLKPDVLQNNGLDPKNKLAKENSQTSKSKDNDLITKKKSDRLIRKEIEEKEYWAQKRKEVSSFKPKKFVINIMRLPELSVYYLNKLSLNKITCNGKTLCEIENMGDLNIKSSQDKEKTSHSTDNTFKMNKEKTSETTARKRSETVDFKKALLNDSESDNDLITEANKVTSSLLNNSDSECDCLETEKNELVKKSQFNDSNGSKDSKTKSKKKKSESDDKSRDSNVINNSDSDDSKDSKTKKSKKEYQVRDKDTDAKNSLLYDSDYPKDSDTKKSKKESQVSDNDKNTDAIKNSLLNDSDDSKDSDTKKSKKESQVSDKDKDTDAIKNSLLNDSDDSKDSQTRKSKKEAQLVTSWDKVRNVLLHDSDSASVDKANSANNSDEELHYETDKSENSLEKFDYEKDKSEQAKSENTLDKLNCETDKSEQSKSEKLHYASDESEQLNNEKTPEKLNYSADKSEQSKSEKSPEKLYYESDKNELAKSEKSSEEHNETNKSQQAKSEKSPDKHHCDTDKSQQAKSEKSPEKLHYASDENEQPNNAKTPKKPQNSSSDEKTNTPLSQRRISRSLSPLSKKKRLRESVHAKKMLMTYSSSSDTEDEKLKDVFKEIKDCLLHGSDEETASKRKSSSSAEDNILTKVKKKILEVSDDEKQPKHKRKKHRKRVANDNSDQSDSSSNKMVRSKSKPGNCSSQNSDAQDTNDKDIDGLTNLESLNKTRSHRRNSDATDQTDSTSVATRRSGKKTGLICEEMLKAESSSDAASDDDNDNIEEELPTVTIPNFNGDSEHLVKEDLLGDSDDSSESQNEDANKDDSESEEKAQNARRRKANAISSDSEVGSSRKKDVVKVSDFEDSEEDTSETGKRTKRKKKDIDSDASGDSSNEGGKKKRRRIKSINDSDVSGSESETEGRNKHGRKNIRKVMGKNQLEEATKKAAREEKERMARIAERQKLYNNLEFDESGKPDEVVLEKVVLDFDPETKEPLIEVDRGLVKKLKPHQANGIKFMWDACFESVKRIKKGPGSGCILAHCMGLGKTLQVVSLTHTLLTHADLTRVNRVLVVCPLSTVLNWVNEFKMWLQHAVTDYDVDVYELSRFKQNSERAFQLSQWFTHGGVCVLGYEMFRNLSADNNKKFKKKMLKNFQESLVDPGPDLVVCDEGHLLKNEKTSLSQSMNRVRTLRRIVLTGTPLQNNLKEYYCMVTFVKPNLLGKYNEYLNRFVNPITNGQYTDSTEHDIKIMKRRSHVLHKMLDGAVQRRDYGVLAPFLPPKHEYVLFITLSEVQVKLYQHYLDNFSRQPLPGKSSGFLFPDFQSLQRIWTHPLVLKYNSERYEILQQKKRDKEEEDSEGSLVDFIDDDSVTEGSSTEEPTDDSSDMSDDSRKKSKKKKKSSKKSKNKDKEPKGDGPARGRRGTRANPIEHEVDDNDDDIIEVKNENPTEWWIKLVTEDELDDMRNSHKLILLFDILRQCEAIGDKLLVFSQSLYSLDLIEHFLGKVDEATQEGRIDEKLGGHVGSWSPGVDYFRLDGSTSCENRSIWCKNFNREDNPRARLFLISTRAGGLGINLVAANRVVIFDVSWNPSHDVQSIFRVYRFGQKKPCYVYRFLAMGTMEEKIYERQVTKQAISKRVIDEQQIDRHYAENDLAELYKFEPKPPSPRPIPPLPKDRLFAEMLREHDAQIYKYHEHDSLLENKEEETLSEEERKAAWEDFENEKNRPPPAPYAAPWPMHNGMVPNILAQQQQYAAAYAALGATLRKEVPNISDDQIKAMLPLIYNANPQLMQKMNDLYKYTNMSGMMNAGMMMNPGVMNAASGTGAGGMSGMGGASGLQYEPPWQRQQQQQQQMRLQQLMQQQNQMGAKLYAGGLGSRDPVAMALQQQRAREIMLGGASSRPRGRPPLQPRAPPPSADIVNLDSD